VPIILDNIRDDSDEEKRILGLELLNALCPHLGRDISQNYLIYELISMQDDNIYRVRKATVLNLVNMCKTVQVEMFQGALFPVYKKLAQDSIWGVRRSAVEVLPEISKLCPDHVKSGELIKIFQRFASDNQKWVKMATF